MTRRAAWLTIGVSSIAFVACYSGYDASHMQAEAAGADGSAKPPVALEPSTPATYVAKVKNVLVGLPPSDDEVKLVERDPSALAVLVDEWMTLPEYEQKMRTFFGLAFQQTQISAIDFAAQATPRTIVPASPWQAQIVQNARESFARTVLALSAEGRPFTEAMTTGRFMMTPALMELYAFLDAWQVDDDGNVADSFRAQYPTQPITVEAASGPIPLSASIDPASPSFLHFYNPEVANDGDGQPDGCAIDPVVFPSNAVTLHFLLYGALDSRKNPADSVHPCHLTSGTDASSFLTADDFTNWRMVTIRAPRSGEQTSRFYNLPKLRIATELYLTVPRVGFFSTPAFFANWQTNASNQARVTTNQTLIVALGAAVDGSDATTPSSTPGLDAAHTSQPACVGCHRTLDPTRSIFASTYSWTYHHQTDPAFSSQPGLFAFHGVVKPVVNMTDFGATLAHHPMLPGAWLQKLCYYAGSASCLLDDPEVLRVESVWKQAGMSWNVLVRELMSSPLITNSAPTASLSAHGEVVAIARRDHLCAALNARLGLVDVCHLDATTGPAQTSVPGIVASLPSDGYGRGSLAPVLPNQPTLFFRAGIENICAGLSPLVIDASTPTDGPRRWSSTSPNEAIADFVSVIMALPPSDARSAPVTAALRHHFTAAMASGATPTSALRSTFVVSCLAPSSFSIGL